MCALVTKHHFIFWYLALLPFSKWWFYRFFCCFRSEWCTKLQPEIDGIDPDEVFSKVPYEKGSLFLLYLETQIVGGQDAMLVRACFSCLCVC